MNISDLLLARFTKDFVSKIDFSRTLGLTRVNKLSELIFLHDDYFENDRKIKNVERAVLLREFPQEKEIGWISYKKILEIAAKKEELARQLILFFLDSGKIFGLEPYEIEVLQTACNLGKIYDEICLLWRQDVCQNELNKRAKELNYLDKYSVIQENSSGEIIQVPYAARYKAQIRILTNSWRKVAKKIISYTSDVNAVGLAQYLLAYCDALEDENLETCFENWLGVSRIWMQKVKGRLQPIHAEESSYYDENGLRIFPDFRLSLKIESLEEEMIRTQRSLEKYLGEKYGNLDVYKSSLTALSKVQLYPITDIVYCGSLDFQPAGQSLPNDDSVQKERGTKVFLNGEVINSRWEVALNLAKKVFPKDFHLFENVAPEFDGMAVMVAGHEYGEPMFTDRTVVEALGADVEALLNEDLATLCITSVMPQRLRNGELTNQTYLNHAVDLLGCYLRYIDTARGVSHLRPYYIGMCLLGLRRMLDCGFIKKVGTDWRVDVSKIDDLYELSIADMHRQVMIAQTKSLALAKNYLSYAVENEEIQDVILVIGSKIN